MARKSESAVENKDEQSYENTVHITVQSKGGVGKSLANSMLAQFFARGGFEMRGYDTDQLNTTFAQYKELPVQVINILDDAASIDPRKFDGLVEKLLLPGGVAVVDTGSNSYTAMLSYLVENNVFEFLAANGKKVYLHMIIAGGDNYKDTLHSFNQIVSQVEVPVVLWANWSFGLLQDENGVKLEDSAEFNSFKDKLAGIVIMEKYNPLTFEVDIKKMTKARLTVAQVLLDARFNVMEKQRVKVFADSLFNQLGELAFN